MVIEFHTTIKIIKVHTCTCQVSIFPHEKLCNRMYQLSCKSQQAKIGEKCNSKTQEKKNRLLTLPSLISSCEVIHHMDYKEILQIEFLKSRT